MLENCEPFLRRSDISDLVSQAPCLDLGYLAVEAALPSQVLHHISGL